MGECMLDLATSPYVLRSDNAPEFVSDVIRWMNEELSIRHVTSSTYHPQSQGMVERMHRTLNAVVRGLVEEHPEDWEEMPPLLHNVSCGLLPWKY